MLIHRRCSVLLFIGFLAALLFVFSFVADPAGAAQVKLAWDPNTEPEVSGYTVYVGSSPGVYTRAEDAGGSTEHTITGLIEGQTYYFSVTAYSTAGTESAFAQEVAYTVPGDSTGAVTGISGGGGGGGGCFIATAAFGSPLAPQVQVLRAFRDRVLMASRPGRVLVDLYYAYSPPVAEYIKYRESARALVRAGITLLILALAHPEWTLLIVIAIVLFLAVLPVARGRSRYPSAR